MKKVLIVWAGTLLMAACNPSNNNPGESGAMDDGINAVDSNGGLMDTSGGATLSPATDTALGEDRVDIQQRGTADTTTPQ